MLQCDRGCSRREIHVNMGSFFTPPPLLHRPLDSLQDDRVTEALGASSARKPSWEYPRFFKEFRSAALTDCCAREMPAMSLVPVAYVLLAIQLVLFLLYVTGRWFLIPVFFEVLKILFQIQIHVLRSAFKWIAPSRKDLASETALITGAGSGIGRLIALLLAKKGRHADLFVQTVCGHFLGDSAFCLYTPSLSVVLRR